MSPRIYLYLKEGSVVLRLETYFSNKKSSIYKSEFEKGLLTQGHRKLN